MSMLSASATLPADPWLGLLLLLGSAVGLIIMLIQHLHLRRELKIQWRQQACLRERLRLRLAVIQHMSGSVQVAANMDSAYALQLADLHMAEQLSQTRTALLIRESGNIRRALHDIGGRLELALADRAHPEYSLVEIAYQHARHMRDLVSNILDAEQLETGKLQLSPSRVGLRLLVESIVAEYTGPVRRSDSELLLSIDGRYSGDVLIDARRFKQLLSNLIGNACAFIGPGFILLSVLCRNSGQGWLNMDLMLHANPAGAASSIASKVAKQEVDPAPRLCHELAKLMGGRLVVFKAPDDGLVLQLQLLLRDLGETSVADQKQPTDCVNRSLKVLIAEDHPSNQKLLRQQISYLGYQATVAENGRQAWAIWQAGGYDLVLTDFNMPLMDGLELVQSIRQCEHQRNLAACLIIGICADARPEEIQRYISAGMNDYLLKPYELGMLKKTIQSLQSGQAQPEQPAVPQGKAEGLYAIKDVLGPAPPTVRAQFINELINSNDADLARIRDGIARQDWRLIISIAHRIKGAASLINANALVVCCEALKSVAESEPAEPTAQACFLQLAHEIAQLKQALQQDSATS